MPEAVFVSSGGPTPAMFMSSDSLDLVARVFNHNRELGYINVKTTATPGHMARPLDATLDSLRAPLIAGNGSADNPWIVLPVHAGRHAGGCCS